MKNTLLVIFLIIPIFCFSQFNFGPKLGMNLHNFVISPEEYTEGNVKFGLAGGLFFRGQTEKKFFQIEGLFSQRNADYTFNYFELNSDTTLLNRVNYIDIPIFYGIRFSEKFRMGTGPVLYILNKDIVSYEIEGNEASISIDDRVFKEFNMGWQLGMCVDVPKFIFELRYELGVSNLIKDFDIPQTDISLSPKARSNMWQLTVGYKFL